jgi:hemolysin III
MKETINDFTRFEEVWHGISHGFGLFLSTFGFGVLFGMALLGGDADKIWTSIVFGFGLLTMYGASTLYHSIPYYRVKSILQIMDHAAIYILIASTYTPIVVLGVQGVFGWILFGIVWFLAVVGVFLKFAYPRRFEVFSLVLYAVMGWMVIFAVNPLVEHAGWLVFSLLLAGGITYTVGIFFYVKESIKLNHAIWHLFVLGGSVFHYFSVLLLIKGTN